MARLGDCFCVIRNGASIKQMDDAGGLPITRIETISNREVDRNKLGYAGIKDAQKYQDYLLQDCDILMSHINSTKHLGKAAIYRKKENEQIIHGMNLLMLRANQSVICPQYAFYYFDSDDFKRQILRITKNSVNQASFTVTALKELNIPLPSLDEQRKIAAVLDKISDLTVKRRRQLDKLDELVKSRFVEMFGDPLLNTKGWAQVAINDVCAYILGGGTPSKSNPEYFTGTIPWVSPKDMKTSIIDDSIDHITEDAIANSATNLVPQNSILMVVRSGILKHSLPVAINIVPVAINQDMKAFILNNRITAEYFMYYLKSIEQDILGNVRCVTADNIDFKAFQTRQISLPPLKLQQQFTSFLAYSNAFRFLVYNSLKKLELLKLMLSQEYFLMG